MKKCKKCGIMISDTAGDYCNDCIERSKFIGEEKFLNTFSNFMMVFGVIASIILACTIVVVEKKTYMGEYSFTDKEFSFTGLTITLTTLISSILFPLLMKLFVKMSVNIREISKK